MPTDRGVPEGSGGRPGGVPPRPPHLDGAAGAAGEAAGEVELESGELVSYAVDLWFDDGDLLVDLELLVAAMREAAAAGNARVLGESTHVFPNGAVTAALILSQSHLTIHTWPEFRLANVDLLAYGLLNGQAIISRIEHLLRPVRVNASRLLREVRPLD